MEIIKKYKSQLLFHLALNLIIGLFITYSSYYHLPLNNVVDHFFYFLHFLIVQFTVFGFIYILSLNKYVFYSLFPILFIIHAIIAYWVYLLDISITDSIIQASLETKTDIVYDLISLPLIVFFLVLILTLSFSIKLYNRIGVNQLKSPLLIISIIGIISFFVVENYKCCTLKRRLPYSPTFGLIQYFQKPKTKLISINNPIKSTAENLNIIFVLGEAVRADHLQLNGYYRKTTPLLNNRNNVISYPNAYTPLTYTAISVPQIVSNASIDEPNPKMVYSIYSILNKLKFKTSWIGNQTPEKSYKIFIDENKNVQLIDQFHSVLSFKKKLDEHLLPPFENIFNNTTNQFITLHMIGSHWWYENKYSDDFRRYTPVTKSKHIPSVTQQEVINSYDNTILYLDDFLNDVISTVEKSSSNTLVIYISDHGENLGENGKWLHGQGNKASKNPAVIFWFSEGFKQNYPKRVVALKNNSSKIFSLDFFYHSILDVLDVEGIEYDKNKSVFN